MSLAVFNGGRTLHAGELAAGEQITYLLTITFAGREFRWSYPGACDLEKDDGTVLSFHGMDQPEMVQAMDFETDSPADLSVSFDGLVFPGDIDLPFLIAQGHRLERAVGELAAIVADGDHTWEERFIILQGYLSEPVYGDPTLPQNAVGFTLESPSYEDSALFPPSSHIINSSDFPDEYQGYVKPFVFGQPGVYSEGWLTASVADYATVYKGTPLIPITMGGFDIGYLAAGHLVAPDTYDASIAWLDIYDATDGTTFAATALERADAFEGFSGGDQSFTVALATAWDPTHEYWIRGWTDTTTATAQYGGYPDEDWTHPMTSAGELLEYMLAQSSLTVDKGRCAVAAQLLSGFKLGGYIAEQVTPYEWIVDNLIPILPVALVSGPKGIYPVVWRYDATSKDAVDRITEGAHFRRVSGVTVDDSSIINEFTLNYISDGGTFRRSLTLSGSIDDTDEDGSDIVLGGTSVSFYRPNLFARRSYLDHDKQTYSDSLDTEHVWDDATAALIAAWKIRAHAFATRTITYQSGFSYAWLEPGDVILLTDSDLYLTEQVCFIQSKTWDVTGLQFEVRIISDPPRDARPV